MYRFESRQAVSFFRVYIHMHTIQCCYCLCFWVKQMPKNTIFVESTKWICQMNLSRWMYFDCGALLLYQTRQSQTCVKKVTPRPAHTVKLSRRKFKKKETCWPCTTSLVFLLSRFGYIYLVHSTGLEPVSRRVKSPTLSKQSFPVTKSYNLGDVQ
jgi:hypothetical protein